MIQGTESKVTNQSALRIVRPSRGVGVSDLGLGDTP